MYSFLVSCVLPPSSLGWGGSHTAAQIQVLRFYHVTFIFPWCIELPVAGPMQLQGGPHLVPGVGMFASLTNTKLSYHETPSAHEDLRTQVTLSH